MTSSNVRDKLVEALVLDLIGPIHDPARATERLDQSPSRWYLTGFLVPRDRPSKDLPANEDEDDEENDLFGSDDDPVDEPTAEAVVDDDADKSATTMTGKRQILPSSMGLSVLVPSESKSLDVVVFWGDYHPELADDHPEPDAEPEPLTLSAKPAEKPRKPPRKVRAWARVPRQEKVSLKLEGPFDRPRQEAVPRSEGLRLVWLSRTAPQEALDSRLVPHGAQTVNIYLVNTRDPLRGPEKDQRMAFQAELTVTCSEGFAPRPSLSGLNSDDDDERLADLQYGDVYEYAVGHNVSAVAEMDEHRRCQTVRTAWIPTAEVERVEPASLQGIELGMEALVRLKSADEARTALIGLVGQYRAWIETQRARAANLHYERRTETCESLLHTAGIAADRIRELTK